MAHPSQRLVSAVLTAALSLNGAGCGTVPAQQRVSDGVTVSVAPDSDGWTRIHAVPTWSNGKSADEYLTFRTDSAGGYLLLAYERGHGLVPLTFGKAEPPSKSSSRSWSLPVGGPDPVGAGLLIIAALAVVGVVALVQRATASKSGTASSRPGPDCCFIWVEDVETGEVLAGASPWGNPSQVRQAAIEPPVLCCSPL